MPLNTAVVFHTGTLNDAHEIFFEDLCAFILLVVDVSVGPAITDKSFFLQFSNRLFLLVLSNKTK